MPNTKSINAQKHLLEVREKEFPDLDLSQDWLELAKLYEGLGSRANVAYCKNRAAKWPPKEPPNPSSDEAPEAPPDEFEFYWQSRADMGARP